MNVFATDLGTHCGYAYNEGAKLSVGTWELATAKEVKAWGKTRLTRRQDPRANRLCQLLDNLPLFDVIVFEDVLFASSTLQVQLWSALRATVWLCGKATIFEAVPVQTLKLFAAGSGAADKDRMSAALKTKHPDIWTAELDDNAVDASWLWLFVKENLTRAFA